MSEPALEVVDPGLQTTVQDDGRPGLGSLGVPLAGACDPTALAVANLLLGNRPGAAVVEATLVGPELLALTDVVIALAGADLGAVAVPAGRRLANLAAHRLEAGERLRLPGPPDPGSTGSRAYLAIAGGVDVPTVLGSSSTSLVGAFGGVAGRALQPGDHLRALGPTPGDRRLERRRWPPDLALPGPPEAIAILAGPAAEVAGGAAALATLVETDWRVAAASDRRGLRLEGPPLTIDLEADGPSHGVPVGTIQVTPSGQPLVLLPDAGPTGGYPVIAVVATAARGIAGQARPGATIRFRLVDPDAARAAERERRHVLAVGSDRLGRTDPWDDLPDLAGA